MASFARCNHRCRFRLMKLGAPYLAGLLGGATRQVIDAIEGKGNARRVLPGDAAQRTL
jgi:hypothetical protein